MFGRNETYQDRARSYLDRQFNKELPKLAKKARHRMEHLDLDRDVLARAGLMRTSRAPGLGTALGIFALGGITGGILALLWATKTGAQTREQVKQTAQNLMNQNQHQNQHGRQPASEQDLSNTARGSSLPV